MCFLCAVFLKLLQMLKDFQKKNSADHNLGEGSILCLPNVFVYVYGQRSSERCHALKTGGNAYFTRFFFQ